MTIMTPSHPTSATLTSRRGRWLPASHAALNQWLRATIADAERGAEPFHPVVRELQDMIEGSPVLTMYFTQMFTQQPRFPPPPGSGDVKLKDYRQMLVVMNHVLTRAPDFNTTGMVGFPINAILDFPMITAAGLAAFTMPEVNAVLRKYLDTWKSYLDSPASLSVLNDSPTGWLSKEAREAIHLDDYVTQPEKPYLGFTSWNDFFIRRFKPGKRPVAAPDDPERDRERLRVGPLRDPVPGERERHLLGQEPALFARPDAQRPLRRPVRRGDGVPGIPQRRDYHRWHSPVSGTVVRVENVPGTYYAEAASEGFDAAGPNNSQGYIAHVATRALIFIEADNPRIGLLCVVPIGMAEVSSCLTVGPDGLPLQEGQHVHKGDQIGYFQFGGSTHCLVFGPNADIDFVSRAVPQGSNGAGSAIVHVNSYLATAR